jgi:hypothetical protein
VRRTSVHTMLCWPFFQLRTRNDNVYNRPRDDEDEDEDGDGDDEDLGAEDGEDPADPVEEEGFGTL